MTNINTHTSARVLQFIDQYIRDAGWAPTIREIGRGTGVTSTSQVHCHLLHLEENHYIDRVHGSPRAIRVVKPVYENPVLGSAAVLTDTQLAEVRRRWSPGVQAGVGRRRSNVVELAAEFGVTTYRIRQVCQGEIGALDD